MRAYTRRRIKASAKLGLATIPFAVLLRWSDPQALVQGSILLGFSFGFLVGVAELFLFGNRFRHLRFLPHLLVKSLILMGVMYAAFAALNLLDVVIDGVSWGEYFGTLTSPSLLLGLLVALGVISSLLFFVHLDRLLGPGVLVGYLFGRYHLPRHEERIFMFLDLKDSTRLAEGMHPDRYFSFLHRFFAELSEPILETDAEIYQYVGDEVVLTWKMDQGLREAACVKVFFQFSRQIEANRQQFLRDFGVVPEFKAGLHAGTVVAAQIGDLKREIVYSGDVLNTTARIEAQCNTLGHRLLVSKSLASRLDPDPTLVLRNLGSFSLRGKEEALELCAVYEKGHTSANT